MLTKEEMLRILGKTNFGYSYKEKIIVQAPAFYKFPVGDYNDSCPNLYLQKERKLSHEEQMEILEAEHSKIVQKLEGIFQNV